MHMTQQLGWPMLEERRNQLKLTMMYKIINGLVYIQQNLPLTYSNLNNTFHGHTYKFTQPATRVDCYRFSFFSSTISMWNKLPSSMVRAGTLDQFKNSFLID